MAQFNGYSALSTARAQYRRIAARMTPANYGVLRAVRAVRALGGTERR